MPRSKRDPHADLINFVMDSDALTAQSLVKTLQVLVDRRLEKVGSGVAPRRPRPVAMPAAPVAAAVDRTPRRRRRTRAEMQAAELGHQMTGAPGLPSGEVGG